MLIQEDSYDPENFSETTREILREIDSMFDKVYMQEYYPNNPILTEAINQQKETFISALKKLIDAIQYFSKKFMSIARKLVDTNKIWTQKMKNKNLEKVVPRNFLIEIYPYWLGESKLRNYRFPEFRESPEFYSELEDLESFKKKYFQDLYVNIDGKTLFNPKVAFQGGDRKIKMNKRMFIQRYDTMMKFVEEYADIANSINVRNNKIIELLNSTINKIRTAVFRESNEIMDTINMLLEQDGGPATSSNVSSDDPNKPDRREEGKDSNRAVRQMVKARETYNRLVYSINASRMGVAEACYNAYVKAIHAALGGDAK